MEVKLPFSSEAERALLGTIVLQPTLVHDAAQMLDAQDFHLDPHRRIFQRMLDLSENGKPIDLMTLSDELGKRKELNSVGGVAYLSSLIDGVPHSPSLSRYAEIVRDKAMLREVINAAHHAIAKAQDQSEPAIEVVGAITETLLRIEGDSVKELGKSLRQLLMPVINEMLQQRTSGGQLIGLSTGLNELDAMTTGIRDKELWIVGALPARGKTSFGLQVAIENAQRDVPVAFFSLEMSKEQIVRRIIAANSNFDADVIRNPALLKHDEHAPSRLLSLAEGLAGWPLIIDDTPSLSVREMTARARLYIRRYKVKLIVVDYLKLVSAPGKELRERVSNVAESLRRLAKEEGVPVIALSQLSRPRDKDLNARPTMLDLKESGDLEASGHVVLLLYRPVDEQGVFTGADEVIIGKNREGESGPINAFYNTRKLRFFARASA